MLTSDKTIFSLHDAKSLNLIKMCSRVFMFTNQQILDDNDNLITFNAF